MQLIFLLILIGCCSKDGRYGIFAPSRGGLDLLDLRHGNVVKTLIPKTAEGIFNVICQFNPKRCARAPRLGCLWSTVDTNALSEFVSDVGINDEINESILDISHHSQLLIRQS